MGILARRFLTGFRQTETNEPGLELNEDGTVDLVNPDGSRTALPGGSSSVLVATKTVTAAEVLALGTTSVALIAGSAGKVIRVLSGTIQLDYNSVPYVQDAANDVEVTQALTDPLSTPGVLVFAIDPGQGFFDKSEDYVWQSIFQGSGAVGGVVAAGTAVSDSSIWLSNFGVALTGGNSPLVVTLAYTLTALV